MEATLELAILFYSRHNIKSMKLYRTLQELQSLGLDMQAVSVDSADVREHLLSDTRYNIKSVPSILTVYDNSQFVVLTGREMDQWMMELVENVRNMNTQENTQIEQYNDQQPLYTPINVGGYQTPQSSQISPLGVPGAPPPDQNLSQVPESQMVKEIKKKDVNPSELAAEMLKQRENYDENLEKNRPFM